MEPLKPDVKERLLRTNPQAEPDDIEEYERLLAIRFLVDPDMPKSPEEAAIEDEREARLRELYRKLFRN